MFISWLRLLACPMCAQATPSRVGWLLPLLLLVPYLVALVVIRSVRRLGPDP
jgi:hypothetical protein